MIIKIGYGDNSYHMTQKKIYRGLENYLLFFKWLKCLHQLIIKWQLSVLDFYMLNKSFIRLFIDQQKRYVQVCVRRCACQNPMRNLQSLYFIDFNKKNPFMYECLLRQVLSTTSTLPFLCSKLLKTSKECFRSRPI